MICSSEKRFFTSNLLGIGNWTPNRCATQTRGDVGRTASILNSSVYRLLLMDTSESVIFYDLEMSRKHWAYQFHNQRPSMHVRNCGKDVDVGEIPGGQCQSIRRTPPWCVRSRLSISAPAHDRCLATSFCTDPSEVAPCEGDAHPGLLRPR
ncbi:hypothetical protein EBA03_16115 [Xanthomonas oryzae pv. oryzae]|nr:hypothetical protein EBA03_16115 [Xanthomonas oryzae pv. oryzae]